MYTGFSCFFFMQNAVVLGNHSFRPCSSEVAGTTHRPLRSLHCQNSRLCTPTDRQAKYCYRVAKKGYYGYLEYKSAHPIMLVGNRQQKTTFSCEFSSKFKVASLQKTYLIPRDINCSTNNTTFSYSDTGRRIYSISSHWHKIISIQQT